jgi:hypothetical protein
MQNAIIQPATTPRLSDITTSAGTGFALTNNSSLTTGTVLIRSGRDPIYYVLTANRTGAINVDLDKSNAREQDTFRVVSSQASPGAFAISVRNGSGGTTIGTIQASKNGFVDAVFDGTNWNFVGASNY